MTFFLCRSILSFVAAIANATAEERENIYGYLGRKISHELVKSILRYLENSETRHGLLSNGDQNV